MMMIKIARGIFVALAGIAITPAAALAEGPVGAVKVECAGHCELVNLGQICDSYSVDSLPVAVACDDTIAGSVWPQARTCGFAGCRPFGDLERDDALSAYCGDTPGHDAIVTCQQDGAAVLHESATRKVNDGDGQSK